MLRSSPKRGRVERAALALLLPASALASAPALAQRPTPATMAALPVAETRGYGADVPFIEHEAENAVTNGRVIGPDRTFTRLPSEASGRRAVVLEGQGRFVEFTLAAPANAVTVRYAVPDTADGRGLDATLSVYAGGARIGALATTSRYGWFYGAYPFTNRPADGKPHHFYDEARLRLPRTLPAGTRVRIAVGPEDRAPWYAVDLADFELVAAPATPPPGALSVLAFGADPMGVREVSAALKRGIAAARRARRPLWLPPGTYRLERHVTVDRVAIVGAGPWHSVIRGRGAGLYGRKAPRGSTAVTLRGFALIGAVTERVDKLQLSGIGGAIGGGSLIEDLWLQHHKVGLWFDGPMDGITLRRLRILDMTADGLNFRRGVRNAVMEHSFVRNAGDDGLAMWSHREADAGNAFRRNTVIAPILANGIAIYGGRDIAVEGNLVADTLTQGGGIHLGNRFTAVPAAGDMRITDNLLVRAGSWDPNWRHGVGAIWFYALDAPIDAAITVARNRVVDATRSALHVIGSSVRTLAVDDLRIEGAGSFALQVQAAGAARFSGLRATGLALGGTARCRPDFATVGAPADVAADCANLP